MLNLAECQPHCRDELSSVKRFPTRYHNKRVNVNDNVTEELSEH